MLTEEPIGAIEFFNYIAQGISFSFHSDVFNFFYWKYFYHFVRSITSLLSTCEKQINKQYFKV